MLTKLTAVPLATQVAAMLGLLKRAYPDLPDALSKLAWKSLVIVDDTLALLPNEPNDAAA